MSDPHSRESDSKNKNNVNIRVPQVVFSDSDGSSPLVNRNRSRSRSGLRLDTNVGRSRPNSDQDLNFLDSDDENDDEPSTHHKIGHNRSPVSSFFSKLTKSTSRDSNNSAHQSPGPSSPRLKRLSQMVPYIISPLHESDHHNDHTDPPQRSPVSFDSFHSARRSILLEELTPGVIDRGLKLALGGDPDVSISGMWLPVPSGPTNVGSESDTDYHTGDEELDLLGGELHLDDHDFPDQEGIKLNDLNLNVPSYGEMLAISSDVSKKQQPNPRLSLAEDEEALLLLHYKDIEQLGGLKVPALQSKKPTSAPATPGKQISTAFKKFSARVNGRDEDEEPDLMPRSPTLSNSDVGYSGVSDDEDADHHSSGLNHQEDLDFLDDLEHLTFSQIYDDPTADKNQFTESGRKRESLLSKYQLEEEGSSESNNDLRETVGYDDGDLYSQKRNGKSSVEISALDTTDQLSTLTRLSGFERIKTLDDASTSPKPEPLKPTTTRAKDLKLFGNSLKIFGPTSKFRLYCSYLVFQSWFEPMITVLVFFQAGLLAYEQWDYSKTGYVKNDGYTWVDWVLFVVNSLHTIEVTLKIVTFGLIDDSEMFRELNIPQQSTSIWRDYVKYNYERLKLKQRGRRGVQKRGNGNRNGEAKTDTLGLGINTRSLDDARFSRLDVDDKILEKRPLPIHSVTMYDLDEEKTTIQQVPFTRAYLRDMWNRVDFVSCISFWLSFLLSINKHDLRHHIMLFRSLMCLRILRLTNFTHGTSVILKALQKATPELLDVGLFLFCFWVFFAIIGVQSFKSSLRRQCVWFNPNNSSDYYVNDQQFCGSYLEPGTKALMPYVYNDGSSANQIKGYRCPQNSKCVSNLDPYGNTVSFDNIANSFELVFVVMSANTFTDLMYNTMDSDTMAASLFYIFGIFFLTVWIVNLLIAVIVNAFQITRDEVLLQRRKRLNETKLLFNDLKKRIIFNAYKKKSKRLRRYSRIEPIFLVLIVLSLIGQTMRKSTQNASTTSRLYTLESVITLFLLFEIMLRFGLFFPKWRFFFYSKQNCFDLFLAIVTSLLIIPPVYHGIGRAYAWLSVFQIARWYRVVLSIKYIRRIWYNVLGHVKTIFDLSLFYFIFLFLMSIIMSRFFEGTVSKENLNDNPFAMYNLPNSFVSLYAITSTENWTDILYTVQQYAKNKNQQFFGAAFLIFWFMFSNMIVLNIFIAVISENLSVPDADKRKEQIVQYLQHLRREINSDSDKGILTDFKERILLSRHMNKKNSKEEILYLLLSGKVKGFTKDDEINKKLQSENLESKRFSFLTKYAKKIPYVRELYHLLVFRYREFKSNPFFTSNENTQHKIRATNDLGNTFRGMIDEDNQLIRLRKEFLKQNPNFNTVFFMLPPNHRLRRLCQKIVPSSRGDRVGGVEPQRTVSFIFNLLMFLTTCAMVVVACYATPLYRKSQNFDNTWNWLVTVDLNCTLLFSLEFIIKVIADGLVYTPNLYLSSSWNIIDLIVLASLWINLISTIEGSGSFSSIINGLKALRALRLLTLSSKAKDTFQATIIAGFWQILSAATISMTLLFPFSIWGLNLFNGRLGYCLDGESSQSECFGEFKNTVFKWDIVSPNAYVEPPLEFNSFQRSFLSLFEIISLEGWVDMLSNVMNSTGVGTPPSLFASPGNGFFVILFNFISTVFILTLFVSVIIQNYSRNTGRAYETNEQSAWYEVEKILKQVKASKRGDINNYSALRLICHKLIIQKNKYWRLLVNAAFVLHTLALLLEVYPSISGLDYFRYLVYIITSSVFLLQLIVVAFARGPRIFLSSRWNWLTVIIIFGAFATSVISFFVSRETAYANINKLFLVAILLLIIPSIDRLEQLLRYAVASLPTVISLLYTWAILFLVYAIAMNQIFGLTRTGPNTSNNINTRTVTKTLILLFRMSFGEGWNYIMDDFTVSSPNCYYSGNNYESDCGSKAYAYILFISWNILSMFIFLNMFVSLIVDSFSYIYHTSDPHLYITRHERRKFKQAWLKFDPTGTGFIKPEDLQKFLGSLDGVLSYKIYNNGRFSIPELKLKWFHQVDPNDPYSIFVDFPLMDATLNQIDPKKVQIRRLKYERLVEEILMDMRMNNLEMVSFTSVILKVALYAHFEENKCLTLDDFMKRYVAMDKVDIALKERKIYDTLKTVVARWRYRKKNYSKLVDNGSAESGAGDGSYDTSDDPNKPLIFISEYLRHEEDDDDLKLRGRAATLATIGNLRRYGSFNRLNHENNRRNDNMNPFINPFEEEDGEEEDLLREEKLDNKGSNNNETPNDLELHHRLGNPFDDSFNTAANIKKEERVLTGTSSALGKSHLSMAPPSILPLKSSNNLSQDSLHSGKGDSELTSLLSIDLSSSPRRQ